MIDINTQGLAIKQITRVAHCDKVYNLSIHEDESYVAEGVVVHNCRCRVVSRTARSMSTVVSGTTISGLPDRGFTSGRPSLAL